MCQMVGLLNQKKNLKKPENKTVKMEKNFATFLKTKLFNPKNNNIPSSKHYPFVVFVHNDKV